jgi:ribose transport system permease protein
MSQTREDIAADDPQAAGLNQSMGVDAPLVSAKGDAAAGYGRQILTSWGQHLSLLLALALLVVLLTYLKGDIFLSQDNLINIAVSVVLLGLVALPQTLAILSAGIDVSVGSTVGLTSIVAALFAARADSAGSATIAILAALAVGALCGAFNGILITAGRVNPFIVTLGTYTAYQGVTYIVSGGKATAVINNTFSVINSAHIAGLPLIVWIFFVATLLFGLFMRYTDFGRNVYAVGGNPVAARLVGINVNRYVFGIYTVTGLIGGLAGIILTAQQGSGVPASGAPSLSLQAITAVVLGGAALTGGIGNITGTFLGVLILGVLQNGLLLLNVNALYQPVPQGLLLIIAVLIQQWRGHLNLRTFLGGRTASAAE